MKKDGSAALRAFLIELLLYSVLVIGYFFLTLHLIGDWLNGLSAHHRYIYAITAVLLIFVQAVLLEAVTTFLLRLLRLRPDCCARPKSSPPSLAQWLNYPMMRRRGLLSSSIR